MCYSHGDDTWWNGIKPKGSRVRASQSAALTNSDFHPAKVRSLIPSRLRSTGRVRIICVPDRLHDPRYPDLLRTELHEPFHAVQDFLATQAELKILKRQDVRESDLDRSMSSHE